MKKIIMFIFSIICGLICIYALYSLIGYTVVEFSYPILHSDSGNSYFGGNLIMLGVAAGVLIIFLPIEIILIKKLLGKTHRVKFDNTEINAQR